MIKNRLAKNLRWKVFSVVLAVIMWFSLMNVITPFEYRTFNVNLSLINKEAPAGHGVVVLNADELEQTRVGIKIYAKRPALDELSKLENRKKISAVLNMENFDVLYTRDISEPVTVSISATAPQMINNYDLEIVSITPNDAKVKLDRLVSEKRAVTVDRIGDAKDGYVVMTPVVEPEYVNITGPKSMIDKINSVRVSVDLTNASENISITGIPVIYDENNNELTGFSTNVDDVSIKVTINKQGEILIKEPLISGSPAEDFRVVSVDFEPKSVTVVGSEDSFNSLDSIELPEIDISGLNENKDFVFDLREYLLNTNLSIKNGTSNEVTVTVNVDEEVSKIFDIPKEQIEITNISDDLKMHIPDTIPLTVKGLSSDLQSLEGEDITAKINAGGMGTGSYNIHVSFDLPAGIKQVSGSDVTVVVTGKYDVE